MSNYYWLSSVSVPAHQDDLSDLLFPFLVQEGERFAFALVACTHDGRQALNRKVVCFLEELGLGQVALWPPADPAARASVREFLVDEFSRNDTEVDREVWSLFVFGDKSGLTDFGPDEVATKDGEKIFLLVTPTTVGATIQRPQLALKQNVDLIGKFKANHKTKSGYFRWADGRGFSFRMAEGDKKFIAAMNPLVEPTGLFPNPTEEFPPAKANISFGLALKDPFLPAEWATSECVTLSLTASNYLQIEVKLTEYFFAWSASRSVTVRFTDDNNNLRLRTEVGGNRSGQPVLLEALLGKTPFTLEVQLSLICKLMETLDVPLSDDKMVYPITAGATGRIDASDGSPPFRLKAAEAIRSEPGPLLQFHERDGQVWPQWHESVTPQGGLKLQTVNGNVKEGVLSTQTTSLEALGIDKAGEVRLQAEEGISVDIVDLERVTLPVRMRLVPGTSDDKEQVCMQVALEFNLLEMQLTSEKQCFRLIRGKGADNCQFYDLGLFAIRLPASEPTKLTEQNKHGKIDFRKGEILLQPGAEAGVEELLAVIPGGVGIAPNTESLQKRFPLTLKPLDEPADEPVFFKISRQGITVDGQLRTGARVDLQQSPEFYATTLERSAEGALGEMKITNNVVERGQVFARMTIPGTKSLEGEVHARISQIVDENKKLRTNLAAGLRISGDTTEPTAALSIGYFQASISNPRFSLAWKSADKGDGSWQVGALVDATLSVTPDIKLQNGMTELQGSDAWIVKDLDLVKLSREEIIKEEALRISTRKFAISVFDAVGLRLDGVSLWWEGGQVGVVSNQAAIDFRSIGGIRGGVTVGGLDLLCEDGKVRIHEITSAGVSLSVPGSFGFSGRVGWHQDHRQEEESYFELTGNLVISGVMQLEGMFQYGSGVKRNGRRAHSLAAFASRGGLNRMLLPWLWWQEGGLGAGYNRELGSLSRNPTNTEILEKIDSLEPANPDNWHFVTDDGTFITVVGKAIFTSQPAVRETACGFVLWSMLALDTQSRFFAAGKMWLFSSQKHAQDYASRPSIVAAMQFDPRRPAITFTAMTKRGGTIEQFPQLQQILDRVDTLLTMRLTPELFDIYLEKLNYRQQWIQGDFDFEASWRFSLFRETLLQYVRAKVRGALGDRLEKRPGGFQFSVTLDAGTDYGGLIGRLGAMTWGKLQAHFTASCDAWTKIEFRVRHIEWKGGKSKVDWTTVSKKFSMPRQHVALGFSGEYAFRASGEVAAGARIAVHFSRHICGHELDISPEIKFNTSVLDEVRDTVRHFEAQLDRVAKQAHRNSVLKQADQAAEQLQAIVDQRDEELSEEWFLVESPTNGRWVLMPAFSTGWFVGTYLPGKKDEAYVRFGDHLTIEYSDSQGTSRTIKPAWDRENWPDSVPPPEDAVGDWQELYRLNSLFAESSVPHDDNYQALAELRDRRSTLAELKLVPDERPFQRLRDALRDEDRFTLPADVYPFTYRPSSAPDFEALERKLNHRRKGLQEIESDRTGWRQARAAVLATMLAELDSSGAGSFDLSPVEGSKYTSYIQNGELPDSVNIVRQSAKGLDDDRKPARKKKPADVIRVAQVCQGLCGLIELYKECQEFREGQQAGDHGTGNGSVVVKLVVDVRPLFEPIKVDKKEYGATWFELVDFVRILREDGQVAADRVPLPVEFGRMNQLQQEVLVRPFIFTDTIAVDASQRREVGGKLPGIRYRLQIVPLGMGDLPVNDSRLERLTQDFPLVEPYVSGLRRFPQDLGMVFEPVPDVDDKVKVRARLIHTTADTVTACFPTAELSQDDFEIYYDPVAPRHTGFYGQSVEGGKDRSVQGADQFGDRGRDVRVASEASNREIVSIVGLRPFTQIEPDTLPGHFLLSFAGPADHAYHFFIRPSGSTPLDPVRRLPVWVNRGKLAESADTPRSVPHLEVIQHEPRQWVAKGDFVFAVREATEDDPHHRLLIDWEHSCDPRVGAAEIRVFDQLLGQPLLTQRVEVLDQTAFRESRHDFGDPDQWRGVLPESFRRAKPPELAEESWDKHFWDSDRWFGKGGAGLTERNSVMKVLDEYSRETSKRKDAPTWQALIDDTRGFWRQIALFTADPQNLDSLVVREAIDELRAGLCAQMAGLFPIPSQTPTKQDAFRGLLREYEELRDRVSRLRTTDMSGSDNEDLFDKRADLLAAQRLCEIIEYRQDLMLDALDHSEPELEDPTIVGALRRGDTPQSRDLLRKLGLEEESPEWLPYAAQVVEVFSGWLGIEDPAVDDQELARLESRFPYSTWFFKRMVFEASRSREEDPWKNWRQGRQTAKVLHGDQGALKTLTDGFNTMSADEAIPVVFARPLQEILALTPIAGEQLWTDRTFQIRPHHAMALDRGSAAGPFAKSVIPSDLSPSLPNTYELAPAFPVFLNMMERLGLAVDVVYHDRDLEIRSQSYLVDMLKERIRESKNNLLDNYFFVLVRSRAGDVPVSTDSEFSFVKLMALPKSTKLDRALLTARGIQYDGMSPEDVDSALEWMNSTVVALASMPAAKTGEPLEIWMEQKGGPIAAVPLVGKRCYLSLTLPTVAGVWPGVSICRLSRYELLAEWLNWDTREPDEVAPSQTAMLRPYRVAEPPVTGRPDRAQKTTLAFPANTTPLFTFALPPDASDSRDNLHTAVSTGFRALGLRFRQRPVGAGPLKDILENLAPGDNLIYGDAFSTPLQLVDNLDIPIFPNESALALQHRPYFLEDALEVAAYYQASGGVADPIASKLSRFVRRKPSLMARRRASWHQEGEGEDAVRSVVIHFALHDDLLTDTERKLYSNVPPLPTNIGEKVDVRDCPDLTFSYLLLCEDGDTLPRQFVPLLEVYLPLHPSFGEGDAACLRVEYISSDIEPINKNPPMEAKLVDGKWVFGVTIPIKLKTKLRLPPPKLDNLYVIAGRDVGALGPYEVESTVHQSAKNRYAAP